MKFEYKIISFKKNSDLSFFFIFFVLLKDRLHNVHIYNVVKHLLKMLNVS